jgi:4-carboxymuconolactone decarboxylase
MTTTDIEQQLENLASPREREKHLRGLAVLKQIGGENFGGPVSQLASFSEDLARFTIQYPYGDVLSRDGLDLRTRQILTAATLLAHGSAQSQLSFHLNGLLNAGGTRDDVVDLLFISAGLLGFPTAINAVPIVRDVLAARDETKNATEAQASTAIPDFPSDRLAVHEMARAYPWRGDLRRGASGAQAGPSCVCCNAGGAGEGRGELRRPYRFGFGYGCNL